MNVLKMDDFSGELEDWWDPKTEDHFNEKAECIVNQVSISPTFYEQLLRVQIPKAQ